MSRTLVALCNFDAGNGRLGVKGKPYLGPDGKALFAKGWVHDPAEEAFKAAEEAEAEAERMMKEAKDKKDKAQAEKKEAKKA